MNKIWIFLLITSLSLGSCIKVSEETPAPTAPLFVTSTLPPTRPGLSLPTDIPPTSTSDPSTTTTPGGTASTAQTSCKDSAVLLEDVTVPDNALMTRGEKFTKTWRFMNTGKCNWSGYTIAFVAGDRMETPDSSPVPQTEAGKTVDVSVELTAPSIDGAYTGFYELKNANGETLSIGTESSFWVKILIGNATASTSGPVPTTSGGTPISQPSGPASCNYTSSSSYLNEIASLINNARAQNGLPALAVNPQLALAAQNHSMDMACHGLLSHTGSDGSSVHERIAAAGYSASYSEEIIYGSGYPQTAFDWWMNDQIHRDAILNPNAVEMGVGYAYVADTAYGGYYTVDFGRP
ncbi:MAG: CAP domain-containing protein [Anaerolineae bacterium]|nr:CAP domain-containing protein [Anaerolineae bacterium]MCI0607928.1 CAP domain-containing protein [Anaerolineae bacterium]